MEKVIGLPVEIIIGEIITDAAMSVELEVDTRPKKKERGGMTEEHKQKISEAQRERWRKRKV